MGLALGGVGRGIEQGMDIWRKGQEVKAEEERAKRQKVLQEREDEAYNDQQSLKKNVKKAMGDMPDEPVAGAQPQTPPAVEPTQPAPAGTLAGAQPSAQPAAQDPNAPVVTQPVPPQNVPAIPAGTLSQQPVAPTGPAIQRPAYESQAPAAQPGTLAQQVAPTAQPQAPQPAATKADNSQAGKLERVAQVYEAHGQVDQAMRLREMAKNLRKEGASTFIDGAMAVAPTPDKLAQGPAFAPIDDKQRAAFNAQGVIQIPDGAKIKYVPMKTPDGTAYTDAVVVDKDGNALHGGTLRQYQWVMAVNPEKRQEMERQGKLADAQVRNLDADNKRADTQINILKDSKKFEEWAQRQRIAIDWKRLEQDGDYKDRILQQYEDGVRGKAAAKPLEDRLSPAHKSVLGTLDKQEAHLDAQIKSLEDAVTKGTVEGSFAEFDENGKPTKAAEHVARQRKQLEERRASIALRRSGILSQYDNGAAPAEKDPLGMRGGSSGGAGRGRGDPAAQAAQDKASGAVSDRVTVIQSELEDAKAKGDAPLVAALERELKTLGAAPKAGTLENAAAPAPTAQPKQAAAPAAKAGTLAQAANPDPLNGLSPAQARAKKAEFQAEMKRWEGNPGAKKRIDELRALIERIDNNQY